MYQTQQPFLDTALVDTVEQGEQLILRAQALAHDAEEKLNALTSSWTGLTTLTGSRVSSFPGPECPAAPPDTW
jgi:hypothetical protein